jgi:tRNA (cmo5U34)-methyltransferase
MAPAAPGDSGESKPMETATRDLGYSPPRWEFDNEVVQVFDDMLARSIPQYEVMRGLCFDIAAPFVRPHTAIVDLGCSRGEALAPFVEQFGGQNRHIGVDVSQPMLDACRRRFAQGGKVPVEILELDLRKTYPSVEASVTLSILTLQFTPIEYRQRIVRNVWKHTTPGGVFVVVEKVLAATADIDAILMDRYHRLKAANGYSHDQIERKRLALEGVLVPVTARWNEELLTKAGFGQVDCFWRWCNFAGWVAIKE